MKIFDFRLHAVLFSALACCFVFTSCGYHIGSVMHPQVKTIAIADVKNETKEMNLSAIMRQQLSEQFQFDNSLKVKSIEEADCIVYCRVLKVENKSVTWQAQDNDMIFRPSEFNIEITVEFSVIMPGVSEPLVKTRTLTDSSYYQFNSDPAVGRANGLKQACYRMARQIVEYTVEGW